MNHSNTRGLVLAALALGALWAVAPEAQAKGRKNRNERVELVRASGSPDGDASGTIEMRTARRGPDAVLRVRNLEPRSDYLVVDGATGETLGTLDTNRRGRGRFTFGAPGRGKRNGTDGTDADAPDEVEVVDPDTGETVLEGDVPSDGEEADYDYAYGYADYQSEAGDFASVFLSSFPELEAESFYLSFFPAPSEEDEDNCWCVPYYDFFADTSFGDELPLGVDSATDLAGRKFRIVDTEGNAVVEGTLPEMEEFDYDDFYPCPGTDDGNGGEKPDGGDDGTNAVRGDHRLAGADGTRDDGSNEVPGDDKPDDGDDGDDGSSDAPEYRLEIEGDDGAFVDVGALNVYDPCDWSWIEPWLPEDDGSWDDWNSGWEWDGEWSDDWTGDWTGDPSGDWGGNGLLGIR